MTNKFNFNSDFISFLNLNNNIKYTKDFIKFNLIKKLNLVNNKYLLDNNLIELIKDQPLKESEGKFLIRDVYHLIPFWMNIFNNGTDNIDYIIDLMKEDGENLDFFNKGKKINYVVL